MKFDEETLTKEKKKGNKTTILKCPIVATIVFVYKRFSTAKTYRFILRQNVDNLLCRNEITRKTVKTVRKNNGGLNFTSERLSACYASTNRLYSVSS